MRKFFVLLGMLAGVAFALQAPGNGAAEAVAMPMFGADCLFCTDNTCEAGYHNAWNSHHPNYTRNGGQHLSQPCFAGTCDTMHGPECYRGGGFAMVDMDQLRGSGVPSRFPS